ncbi:dipeptidase [Solimicrobium silvestre]|nr:membrane dipeptidase [Solimicrobium silvestre]
MKEQPIIIDTSGSITNLNLTPAQQKDEFTMGIDQRSINEALASGLTAINMTMGYVFGKEDPFEQTVRQIAAWDALIRRTPESLRKVWTVKDIQAAHTNKQVGVIYGFQNAVMMGDNEHRVEIFANLGVRFIQLTYNTRNSLGDGSMMPENQGLTEFGRKVVHELNRHHVLVDLSHSGEQTCLDAIAASSQPTIISHTGCRALTNLPRNKTDRELRLVAESGGFVGIYFMPFLAIGRQFTSEDLIAHIEHAVNVCGEDHVGIGTDGSVTKIDDMQGYMTELKNEVDHRHATGIAATGERADIVPFLSDLSGTNKFMELADMLAKRGHSSGRIEKILGSNFMNAADRIWSA